MNILLLFFALPVAITILSIIFETIINCPLKIAGITFSILLIVTFAVADETYLIYTIIYTILSYVVAWLTKQWLCNRSNEINLEELLDNVATANTQNQSMCGCNNGCNRRRY